MKKIIKIKKDLMKIYYSQPPDIDTKAVESTLRVQREWHREKLENVISKLNFEGKKILDLACGSGGITRYLKKTVPSANIYAVDFNVNAISYAKKKDRAIKGLKYFVGDAQKIPFRSNFFDVVIGLDMLDHLPDYRTSLSEINRVLKKNGEIVLTVENHHSLWPLVEFFWDHFGYSRDYSHVHVVHFTPKMFREVIENSGFFIKNFYTIHNINTFFNLISDHYPKNINSFMSRKLLGLTLFCHAIKT